MVAGELHESPADARTARLHVWISAALFAAVIAVYAPALGYPFLQYDDPDYVTANAFVRAGVTAEGLERAVEPGHAGNWHPLTWLSHMLDVEMYGLDAGFHRWTNLLLHGMASVLAFALIATCVSRARGAVDRVGAVAAGLAAAAFALHPLRVESVVWISERKDVLSVALGLAAVLAYLHYAERPSWARYAVVGALLAAGLAAKPMLVTLPVLFLVLDAWPLGRLTGSERQVRRLVRLVVEKLPLAALAGASAVLTLAAQRAAGSLSDVAALGLGLRLRNAAVALAAYLGDTLWPAGLSPFYPYPLAGWPATRVAWAAAVLLVVSIAVWRERGRRPWLLTGWLWYAVALVPVLGLVQVGVQARADRYTYLPHVGLFAALAVEGACLAAPRSPAMRRGLAAGAAAIVVALAFTTMSQIRHWRDTEALFERALEVTPDNHVAEYGLSIELVRRGDLAGGLTRAQRAVELRPDSARALEQLGECLARLGRADEALTRLDEALRLAPGRATIHARIGATLLEAGRPVDAIAPLERAVAFAPGLAPAHANLGLALAGAGRPDDAVAAYRRALAIDEGLVEPRLQLGALLVTLGRFAEAETELEAALAARPDDARAHGYLAALDLARGHLASARARAVRARALDPAIADRIDARIREVE